MHYSVRVFKKWICQTKKNVYILLRWNNSVVHNMYHEYFILWYETKIRCAIIKWYKNLLEMPNRPCYWVKMNASSRKRAHTLYVKFQELVFDPPFFVGSLGSSVFLTCYFSKNRMSSMLVAQRFLFQSKLLFNYFDNKEFPALQFSFYV